MEVERKKVTVVIVGCGARGQIYAQYHQLCPNLCQVVAIAEPREVVRQNMQATYGVSSELVFSDWKELSRLGVKVADAAIIATQDRLHLEPAMALAALGYHIMLEKPMSTNLEECQAIAEAVKKHDIIFALGHVLRYTSYSRKVKSLLDSGVIGDIMSIQHLEPIGYYHYAHSYVRGNWSKKEESSSILMAKSCHDIDWMLWVMGKKCTKISSFGSLKHFTKEYKPAGSTDNCLTCPLEPTCGWSAKRLYLDGPRGINQGNTSWPVTVLTPSPTVASVTHALETGPYGRCAYLCDNDVMDNQVVNMQFEDGTTASFTMVAFSEDICIRKTRIFGTRGEMVGDGENKITVFDFGTQKKTTYRPDPPSMDVGGMDGHGSGDFELMKSFIEAVATNNQSLVCDVQKTLESHVVVFEAERAREGNVVRNMEW